MKKSILLLSALLISLLVFAQAPQKMSYQTVIRNATDDLVRNSTVGIQISVLQGSALGTAVYVETHAPTTNANGLASLEIGGGAIVTGTMAAIDWGTGPYYVKSEVDPTGGTSYTLSVTSELLSVPYALHSGSSGTSQWSESGSGINTSNLTVGINSENPAHTLDVRSQSLADPAGLNVSNADRSRYVRLFSGSETIPDPLLYWAPSQNLLFATYDDNTFDLQEKMRISSTGDVGIGINQPEARLDILGGDWDLDSGNPGDLRIGNETNNFRIGIATDGSGAGITRMYTNSNALILGSYDTPMLTLGQNKNVGIGTTNPEAALEINSTGISDELLLLDNSLAPEGEDYGIMFIDNNPTATIGAYIDVDYTAIFALADGDARPAIFAQNYRSTTATKGIDARVSSPEGIGVYGEGPKTGVEGTATNQGVGVRGNGGNRGVEGISLGFIGRGVYGQGTVGVEGVSNLTGGFGVIGESNTGTGVRGNTIGGKGTSGEATGISGIGVYGSGQTGVFAQATGTNAAIGVSGNAAGQFGKAIYAEATGEFGKGVHAKVTSTHSSANAILAESGGGSSYAGYFVGRVHVAGVLSKSSGSFKIDHPLDPENKYLSHSFVESPDMMNIYNGNIVTDEAGSASVVLPNYFDALNIEFRYQLTVIGEFAQAIISEKIEGNKFEIRTDKPNVEVSWQVTGVRNDAFAKKNRIQVEEDKEAANIGTYLNPDVFGVDASRVELVVPKD